MIARLISDSSPVRREPLLDVERKRLSARAISGHAHVQKGAQRCEAQINIAAAERRDQP
jgi:hypothetical protein